MNKPLPINIIDIRHEEFTGLNWRVAEIEWLLVALVILFIEMTSAVIPGKPAILTALTIFSFFILISHYSGLQRLCNKWKLAIDTWAMIVFVSFVLWHTGKIASPLLSLYQLVIITAATTLGETITFLEVGLISAICLFLSFSPLAIPHITLEQLRGPLMLMFPFWLTAYITTRLSKETEFAKHKIEHLSQTDDLTGLWNMRMFSVLTQSELNRSARFGHVFSVMMVDADNLKTVNDTFGHLAGDSLIKLIGKTVQENIRSTDIVARYGGDEFVVLLPETNCSGAFTAAEKVRQSVKATPFTVSGEQIPINVSTGIAGYPDHGTEMLELLNKADSALNKSKGGGKNRTTIFSD